MSNTYNLAIVPGDGTGPEVVAEAMKALDAVSRKYDLHFQVKEFGLGGDQYLRDGTLVPDGVVEEL